MKKILIKTIHQYFRVDAEYFLRGSFWGLLGQAIGLVGGLTVSVLLAHKLSETDYGTYRYILGVGALLSVFSLTGIGQSVMQTAAKKYYGFYAETLKTNFLFNGVVTLLSLVGATYYYSAENIILAIGCILIALFQPIINVYQHSQFFLTGSQHFRESTYSQIVKTIIVSIPTIIGVLLTQNIIYLLGIYLISNAIGNYCIYKFFVPKIFISTPVDILEKYVLYAKHTSVRNIISDIAYRLDTIIIFQHLGATELAIYSIASIVPEQIKGAFKLIPSLLLPKYVNHLNDATLVRSIPKRTFQLFVLFSFIALLYILSAPYIFELLFPKYQSAILYSQILALSFPAAIGFIPLTVLQARMTEKHLHKINLYSSGFLIFLTISLIPTCGIWGAVASKIISRYLNTLICFYYTRNN